MRLTASHGAGRRSLSAPLLAATTALAALGGSDVTYPIVDSGQKTCYDDRQAIHCADAAEFSGQDAHYHGRQPGYRDNGDGTVIDAVTGLMWQKSPDLDDKVTWAQARGGAASLELGGYADWRLPSVKELYSLMQFTGSSHRRVAYLDSTVFDFRFGEQRRGERPIDAQFWSSTEYVGTTMRGDATVFGVNFADGRIKGYPRDRGPGGRPFEAFVRYVRGNPEYGVNRLADNGNGTISDAATGLVWQQVDDGHVRTWSAALAYCEALELAGRGDWRLPNAKELQSIVDYGRAPDASDRARRGAAIDPRFGLSEQESWFWSSTTLLEAPRRQGQGSHAVYVTFGQAYGIMRGRRINVHGAGAQRSDPKAGDPADWAQGLGPQGDEVRILNYARCVRDD